MGEFFGLVSAFFGWVFSGIGAVLIAPMMVLVAPFVLLYRFVKRQAIGKEVCYGVDDVQVVREYQSREEKWNNRVNKFVLETACFYVVFSVLLLILILVFPDLCIEVSAIGLALLPIPLAAFFAFVYHSVKD